MDFFLLWIGVLFRVSLYINHIFYKFCCSFYLRIYVWWKDNLYLFLRLKLILHLNINVFIIYSQAHNDKPDL